MIQKLKRSKRFLLIGFGSSLVILIISSFLSYYSITELLKSQAWVNHTAQVESGLENLISRVKDAETGQRGFLLAGDEIFLEPFTSAQQDVEEKLAEIRRLTADNKSQQDDFPLMERLVNEKFGLIEKTISDKRRGIPPSVNMLLQGKSVMDSIRTLTQTMVGREKKLMVQRDARMDLFVHYTPLLVSIGAFLSMVITLIFYIKINTEIKAGFELQQALELQQKRTEKQVETITNVAKKIAEGDYHVRIDESDLK